MNTPLLNILQVEYVRSGTNGYRPQSPLPFVDLSIQSTIDFFTGYSDHATQVAKLWQANGTAALIKTWYVSEANSFETRGSLEAGYTFEPQAAKWHLAILPFGESATWTHDADLKFAKQCERDNVLGIVSPPDGGQGYFDFPCNAISPNILHVASSTTSSYLTGEGAPEIYFAVDWNSYVQPSIVAEKLAVLFDWLLQNAVAYLASDIKSIIFATAKPGAAGHLMYDGAAALAAVQARYTANSSPAPVQTQSNSSLPPVTTPIPLRIDLFTASNAWSGQATPTKLSWSGSGASATLTDPEGNTIPVPLTGSLTITTGDNPNVTWIFNVYAADGVTKLGKSALLHGKLSAQQIADAKAAAAGTPTTPPPPPPPTPDQLCATAATAAGASYSNGAFSGVTTANISALISALKADGLVAA